MTKCLRIMGLCVSLSVFLGLLGFVTTRAVAGVACPCDFNTLIPKTKACWVDPFTAQPIFTSDVTIPPQPDELCITFGDTKDLAFQIRVRVLVSEDGGINCSTFIRGLIGCGTEVFIGDLTEEQFEACLCDLQAYTNALNQVDGIDVSDSGPPFVCADIECAQPPPPPTIPTLSQYGMIIMAGVLGLFAVIGLILMRRHNPVTN